jgi:hypothetical protein
VDRFASPFEDTSMAGAGWVWPLLKVGFCADWSPGLDGSAITTIRLQTAHLFVL